MSNEGFETFLGTLSVSLGQAVLERGVAIPPGATLAERVQVPVTGLTAGEHRIAVELAGRDGPEDRLELTVPLAAELSLAGLPERGVLQGGATSSVGVRVRNAGSVAGHALLRLTGGDFIKGAR